MTADPWTRSACGAGITLAVGDRAITRAFGILLVGLGIRFVASA